MIKTQTKIVTLLSLIGLAASNYAYAFDTGGLTVKQPTGNTSIANVIVAITAWLLSFAAAVAVLFIIFAGIQMVTAAGNAERLKIARATLTYAVIGLIVIVLSYFIVELVLGLPIKFVG